MKKVRIVKSLKITELIQKTIIVSKYQMAENVPEVLMNSTEGQDLIDDGEVPFEILNQPMIDADQLEVVAEAQSNILPPMDLGKALNEVSATFRALTGNRNDRISEILNGTMTHLIATNDKRGNQAPETVEDFIRMVQESANAV